MTEISPQEVRFQQVLNFPGIELKRYYTETPSNLLPTATTYPDFFNHNLLSPNRVVKRLENDAHANLRVFYFSLFRLTYYIIGQNGQSHVALLNLRNYVLHPEFQILFTPDTQAQRELYNDQQFKKFFAEFLSLLDLQELPDVEFIVNSFPIIDTVMIHILRSVLSKQGHDYEFSAKIPTDIVFVELCNLLGLSLTAYVSCWKFEDSDMFCLQYSDQELYIAYVEEPEQEPAQLPIEQHPIHSVVTISMSIEEVEVDASRAQVPELASNSTPGSSASYYQGQQISMQPPIIGNTGSQPLLVSHSNSELSSPKSTSFKEVAVDPSTVSQIAQSNSISLDHNRSRTDKNSYSLPVPQHKATDSFNQFGSYIQDEMSPGSSVISLASENYDFVDFTNARTIYKDKVPKSKLTWSPNTHPVVHKPAELIEYPRDALFEHKKGDRASPIYQGTSNCYTEESKFDLSKYSPKLDSSQSKQFDFLKSQAPIYEAKRYDSYEYAKPQIPRYQPTKYEPIQYEAFKIKPEIPKLDILSREISYEPSYKPLYSIPQVLSSVQSTQSVFNNPAENTPIYKLNQRSTQSESKSIMDSQRKFSTIIGAPLTTSITSSINNSKDLGDYYRDFTNSFMLEKMQEPFRSNIRAIKNRVRGMKRIKIAPNTFLGHNSAAPQASSARALYEQLRSDRIY